MNTLKLYNGFFNNVGVNPLDSLLAEVIQYILDSQSSVLSNYINIIGSNIGCNGVNKLSSEQNQEYVCPGKNKNKKMKELNTYIIESLQDRHFVKLQNLPAEAIQYCLNMGNDVDDIMYDEDEINKFKTKFNVDLDKKDLSLLATITRYALSSLFVGEATGESVLKFIKNLPARRVNKFIGSGSEGIVFDAGDYIIKIITISDSLNDIGIWRSWAHASECKKLKVIAPIIKHDKDFKWIAMPKLKTPCREGMILSEAIRILYTAYRPDWSDEQIAKVKEKIGKDWIWVEKWFDDFTKDYVTICGVDQADRMCDDIKTANIGKTRDGKILCFDWHDPFVA